MSQSWEWQQFESERRQREQLDELEIKLASECCKNSQAVSQRMLEDFDSVFMVSNGERR